MPRPPKTKAAPSFYAMPHTLSESARTTMAGCLGVTEKELAAREEDNDGFGFWWDVEQWLGAYAPSVENVNRAPAASQYVEEFSALADQALQLVNRFANLNGYLSAQLDRRKFDSDALESGLAQFHDVAKSIAADFRGRGKRGARGDTALLQTILSLRAFFHKHYQGPRSEGRRRGAFKWLSPMDDREEDFVRAALLDARIISKNYRQLRPLFKHPRCALPHERAQTIEQIAAKASAQRKERG